MGSCVWLADLWVVVVVGVEKLAVPAPLPNADGAALSLSPPPVSLPLSVVV